MSWIAWDKVLSRVDDGGPRHRKLETSKACTTREVVVAFQIKKELWKDVITSLYGNDGGFNAPSKAKRKFLCWGTIVNLHSTL